MTCDPIGVAAPAVRESADSSGTDCQRASWRVLPPARTDCALRSGARVDDVVNGQRATLALVLPGTGACGMQQDQMLGASFPLTMEATPMPRTRQLMHNEGMMALNWFARRFSYPGSASIARMHGSLRAQVERRSVVRPVRGKGALFCFGGRVCVLMPAVAVAVRHMGACARASARGGGDGEAGVAL